jgi:hypothetical protein
MAAEPGPPRTRQSVPPAKPAPADEQGGIPHGGPIMPRAQPFNKPNPTDRGQEANTEMHRGTPNPEQHGTHKNREDHDPGMGQSGNTHRPDVPLVLAKGKTAEHSTKVAPPMPNPKGVRK